ncbi:MAG: hypothetical protein QMD16_03025, partial [Desulfitobacteriaceae bacterium]|nr:hypothetical protein [Desulfitobacteriaceae bacterium]
MKLSKIVLVLLGVVALLTVGVPTAKVLASPVSPQIYWTTQQADPNQPVPNTQQPGPNTQQPGQQGPSYAPVYGYWYGPTNPNYWRDYDWFNYPGN